MFLKQHTAYDVLPVSYRLIVMDTTLLMKKALAALIQNGMWQSITAFGLKGFVALGVRCIREVTSQCGERNRFSFGHH